MPGMEGGAADFFLTFDRFFRPKSIGPAEVVRAVTG
jgi:hypothetical protein